MLVGFGVWRVGISYFRLFRGFSERGRLRVDDIYSMFEYLERRFR